MILTPQDKESYIADEILTFITFLTSYNPQLTIANPELLKPQAKKIARKYLTSLSHDEDIKRLITNMLKALCMDSELKLFTQISTPASQTFFRPLFQLRKPENYKPVDNLCL